MKPERALAMLTAKGLTISNKVEGGAKSGSETVNATASKTLRLVKLSASDVAASMAGLRHNCGIHTIHVVA